MVRTKIQQMLSLNRKLDLSKPTTRRGDIEVRKPHDRQPAEHRVLCSEPAFLAALQEKIELFLRRDNYEYLHSNINGK
jgi:hypothetical protein